MKSRIEPAIGWPAFFLIVSAIVLAIVLPSCNLQRCSEGAVCQVTKTTGPSAVPFATPVPTPTPTPAPTVKAESCDFDVLTLRPVDGLTLAVKESGRLSLTPYQTFVCAAPDPRVECTGRAAGDRVLHEVSEACNLALPRLASLIWSNSSPTTVTVGTGYEPAITRLLAGNAVVSATLEGKVSNAVVIR